MLDRIKMFEDEIAKPVLDLKKIREISFYGTWFYLYS